MKKMAENIGFALLILLMAVTALSYLAPHFGWRVDAVLSGSMEPQLKTGAVVITRPIEPESVVVGDIITFRTTTVGENLISHRVIGIEENSPLYFHTKGDVNDDPDPFTVPAQNVVGKICFHIPFLGYATQFLKTFWGFLFALLIPGLIIIVMEVMNIRKVFTSEKIAKEVEGEVLRE